MRMLKSVNHSLDMMDLFLADENPSFTLIEIARLAGLTKAGAHNILANLVHREYLEYDPTTRLYSLGLRVWELGARMLNSFDPRRIALPTLTRLSAQTGETGLLSRYASGSIVYMECVLGAAAVTTYTRPGLRAPAYCTATGKAQLAFLSDSEITDVCASGLVAHTQYTIVEPQLIRAQLLEVRAAGYAINRGEYREDVVGVGAPLFSRAGTVVAAIGLSGPAYRLGREPQRSLSEPILQAAAEIQQMMSRSTDPPVVSVRSSAVSDRSLSKETHAPSVRPGNENSKPMKESMASECDSL